jgi:hypothetical protein
MRIPVSNKVAAGGYCLTLRHSCDWSIPTSGDEHTILILAVNLHTIRSFSVLFVFASISV